MAVCSMPLLIFIISVFSLAIKQYDLGLHTHGSR
jgi:hypothetical protein